VISPHDPAPTGRRRLLPPPRSDSAPNGWSSNPACLPATENDWHGDPKTMRSTGSTALVIAPDIAEIAPFCKPLREDGRCERIDFSAPAPIDPRRRQLRGSDAGKKGAASGFARPPLSRFRYRRAAMIAALDPADSCPADAGGARDLFLCPVRVLPCFDHGRLPLGRQPPIAFGLLPRCQFDALAIRKPPRPWQSSRLRRAPPVKRDAPPAAGQQSGLPFSVRLGHRAASPFHRYCGPRRSSNGPAGEVYRSVRSTQLRTFRLRSAVFPHRPDEHFASALLGFPRNGAYDVDRAAPTRKKHNI
jgi:hypothetical protein